MNGMMAAAAITKDGRVEVPLDEHTMAIAKAAAREAVKEHMETCPIVVEFRTMHADMYGLPGEKDTHVGLMGDVQSLKSFRDNARCGLAGAWVILSGVLIAAITWAAKGIAALLAANPTNLKGP